MAFTENPDVFLADFGVPVVSGGMSGLGIFDLPDSLIAGEVAMSTDYVVTVKRSVFSALKYGDSITVNGASYKVREPRILDDGVFMKVTLSKT